MNQILAIPIGIRLAILALLGTIAGAAINWGIYRLAWYPRAIGPWTRPLPDAPARQFWDGLPVLGWLGLRREANLHGSGFWLRPMVLELLTGTAFALLYWWEIVQCELIPKAVLSPINSPGLPVLRHEQFFAHLVLLGFMLVAFWIDIDEMTIPDGVTIPGTLAGLVILSVFPFALLPDFLVGPFGPDSPPIETSVWHTAPIDYEPWLSPTWTGSAALVGAIAGFCTWCAALLPGRWYTRHGYGRAMRVFWARTVRQRGTYALAAIALLGSAGIAGVWHVGGIHWAGLSSGIAGLVIGGGLIWIVRILGSAVLHREAMGFGDVTILAMIGAFLGWQAAVIVFFVAPLAGLVIGIVRLVAQGEKEIPYGPFLCLAAVGTVLCWNPIWERTSPYFGLGWKLIVVLVVCLGLIVVLLPMVRWMLAVFRR